MTGQYILSDYLDRALAQAEYDKLEDGTFFGRIPACKGVVAFAAALHSAVFIKRTFFLFFPLIFFANNFYRLFNASSNFLSLYRASETARIRPFCRIRAVFRPFGRRRRRCACER